MAKVSLQIGDAAPEFALLDTCGNLIRLDDFRGRKVVVLAFYVRAATPG
jgi:peroxiredoxin Q/BCP